LRPATKLAVGLDAEPRQALGLELLDVLRQLIDQLAAVEARSTGRADAADLLAGLGGLFEDAEIDRRAMFASINRSNAVGCRQIAIALRSTDGSF
jgi:hypothetical protein